jgi:hypothetical protein
MVHCCSGREIFLILHICVKNIEKRWCGERRAKKLGKKWFLSKRNPIFTSSLWSVSQLQLAPLYKGAPFPKSEKPKKESLRNSWGIPGEFLGNSWGMHNLGWQKQAEGGVTQQQTSTTNTATTTLRTTTTQQSIRQCWMLGEEIDC